MSAHVQGAASPVDVPSAERASAYASVRDELRAAHRRLTDEQIDLIASVAVELRLARVRMGFPAERTAS